MGLITNTDLVGLDRTATFSQALSSTVHIREQLFGEGWVAVGDAAVTFDPLSSQGLITGLVLAAHAGQVFTQGLKRWEANYRAVFLEHEQERSTIYSAEQRWADKPFWIRLPAFSAVRWN